MDKSFHKNKWSISVSFWQQTWAFSIHHNCPNLTPLQINPWARHTWKRKPTRLLDTFILYFQKDCLQTGLKRKYQEALKPACNQFCSISLPPCATFVIKTGTEILGGKRREGASLYLTLHCHRQNDIGIKMGSAVSHFTVSLIVQGKVKKLCL